MTQVLSKDRFEGTGLRIGRGAAACACAAALTVSSPVRAGEPEGPATASEELNEQAQKHAVKAIEHFNNGAWVDSEEEFRRVAFFAPNWRPLHFNLGVLAEAQGKLGTAVSEYRSFRPMGSPDEQMIVDQRIDELGRRKHKISGAYKRQIGLSAVAMTLGLGGIGGGVLLFVLRGRNGDKIEELNDQASMYDMTSPAQAAELRGEATDLTKKQNGFLYGGAYLLIFGLLAAGYSFIPLRNAIKSKRQLDGLALGPTRLKWSGGAGATLRF